jgi:alpha-tubulin suppressor-like RCC1 family protein
LVAEDVVEVVAAAAHSLYIDSNGTLWGTGDNSAGQLVKDGDPGYKVWTKIGDDVGMISAGDGFSIILGKDGILKALGANDYGQLGEWKE